MSEIIRSGKFVELTYQVTDRKTGHVLTRVEFPLGYVHGHNEIRRAELLTCAATAPSRAAVPIVDHVEHIDPVGHIDPVDPIGHIDPVVDP